MLSIKGQITIIFGFAGHMSLSPSGSLLCIFYNLENVKIFLSSYAVRNQALEGTGPESYSLRTPVLSHKSVALMGIFHFMRRACLRIKPPKESLARRRKREYRFAMTCSEYLDLP